MKPALRWILISLGVVAGLAVIAAGSLYALGGRKLAARYDVPAERELVIPADSISIERGARLVRALPCGDCHGEDLGGKVFADAGPFALLAAPNLTRGRGGRALPLTDAEWERAIRHGVRRDGTGLLIMPSEVFHAVADDEMAAMIAYLKQLPPVDREVPPLHVRIVGRMVLGAGQLKPAPEILPSAPHVASVDTTPGVEYGRYLVAMSGCAACHGSSFAGGPGVNDDSPPASNLTPTGIGHYTEDDFVNAMRTGVRPRGGAAISEAMPWKYYGTMSDGALRSIHRYLKTFPPKPFGAE